MQFAWQILIHTPLWAFALLAFLVWQGIKAMRPRTVTIWRSLIVPALVVDIGKRVWWPSRLAKADEPDATERSRLTV